MITRVLIMAHQLRGVRCSLRREQLDNIGYSVGRLLTGGIDRVIELVAIAVGDEVVGLGLLAVGQHEGELAARRRLHIHLHAHHARLASDKGRAVAIHSAIPSIVR